MRISDWSSDVCSSDLLRRGEAVLLGNVQRQRLLDLPGLAQQVAEADAVVADVAVGVCACRHEEGELAAEAVSDRAGFAGAGLMRAQRGKGFLDRKSTRLNSSH